ncbi:SRPBCC domain-containing protein [Streptomyces sp. NPDC001381]|uniref:SRPBCC domain-containing protein n=1 Tax=Streptomyces sp. NPDC001381 TaxID=3364567 RepID=UPI0036B8C708
MEHEVFVPVPAERLRAVLADPAQVARAVPGLQQDAGTEPVAGRLKVRIGGHTITYRGSVRVSAREDGAYALAGDATEARGSGSVKLALLARLRDTGTGTTLHFEATAAADGRVAELPEEQVAAAVARLLNRFAENLVTAATAGGGVPGAPAESRAPEEPAGGAVPGESAETAVPGEPVEGAVPGEPAGEAASEEAAESAVPQEPAEGAPPVQPAEGVASGEPAEGAVSGEPAGEAVSEEAAEGAVPQEPAEGATSGEAAEGVVSDEGAEVPPSGLDEEAGDLAPGEPGEPPAEAAHARRTMIGRSAEEVDHAPPRGRYAPVPAPQTIAPNSTLRWAAPAAALVVASAIVVGRALRRRR